MSLLRTIDVKNGEYFQKYRIYKCDCCETEIEEMWPRYDTEDTDYCFECAFKKGLITSKEFLDTGSPFTYGMFDAGINPETNEIEVWSMGSKPSWLKTDKDYRHNAQYSEWRTSVFERDNYTCQKCGKVGGSLNAHHIKTFAKYKKLRYELSNGLTLCEQCHRQEHRKRW